ncbi:hypothetical protein [Salegentibacter flavus]|uniref:ATP synthase protein I n=1 Tax=Salegentibacter flavus TaxID=287099 RepID=A0A1I5A0J1_9FLAO|nr:hypothetical protein [Salegentibacter flavus]SFN55984.1 hypothetical protein SAMN05660413_01616 [Salegentibacter flavus]
MKNNLPGFLKVFLLFSIVLFVIQYLLLNFIFESELFYPVWAIYLFHFFATLIIYSTLIWVHQNFQDKIGFAFMGLSLLKMLAAVIFLLPLILSGIPTTFLNIIAFFIPYFLFLIFETLYVVKLINLK